jgi:DinB family protein
MAPTTPYSDDLNGRDPIDALRETTPKFRTLTTDWSPAQFERSYAPGKWSARQVLIHLAQTELALGARARLALTTPNYVAQAFNQDGWMARDAALTARDALDALTAIATMNRVFFESLSEADRASAFTHPEYGAISIDWLIHQMAGHQIHHLKQIEQIAGQ